MDGYTQFLQSQEEFAKVLADLIRDIMEKKYNYDINVKHLKVLKTNGELDAINFRFNEDEGIAPTLYTGDAYHQYQNGEIDMKSIAEKFCKAAVDAHEQAPRLPDLTPDEAKKHITLTLVNTAMNQGLLEKTPHFEILDGELSAIPRWYIDDHASFIVNNELASRIGLTPDEVLQMGQHHIDAQPFDIKTMQEVLCEMMGQKANDMLPPLEGPQMIVLTSANKIQGSNVLLSEKTLREVHAKLGSNYVILPSSLHEVICVPITNDMKPNDLREMVLQVNSEQVLPEERLSNQIFMHDGQKLSIVGDSFHIQPEKCQMAAEPNSMKMAM